jgi:hypothetical protein
VPICELRALTCLTLLPLPFAEAAIAHPNPWAISLARAGIFSPQRSGGSRGMKSTIVATILLLSAAPAMSHHSTTAYDHSKTIVLTGTVKEFQWTNPHSWVQLIVIDDQGKTTEWAIETGSPNLNLRHGWTRTTLKPGDKVTLTIYPHRDGNPHGSLAFAKLADGRVLDGAADFIPKDNAKDLGAADRTPSPAPNPGAQAPATQKP